ncbi:ABC-2 family transporter protein [Candidatus Izimaplasma bacterium HR1]|jgi:multidrug/hemolysin transport system permease protein|uniref:ABC transporter permease n=1 Tax=Candidatus Izimoplasma sp. HR1 TaxID=1541959 RepID=UPI0004F90AAB|nr:ABC-2 family transporter protein [Candidatus Izimaplasma bacterium HR1]
MEVLYQLVLRNIRLYLRDKAAVFFSFLSVIIILALYIIFLGKMTRSNLPVEILNLDGGDWLVSSWIMAGILTVSTVTVPLGAVGNLIDDRADGLLNDFYTSPIGRNTLALSYLISAWVIGFIMVMINLVIGQVYVLSQGGEFLSLIGYLELIGLVLLCIMAFSSFFFFLSLFIRTRNAYGMLSTLVGTFIGFLGGIYLPIGFFEGFFGKVMNSLPTAHAVALVRKVYMAGAIDKLFSGVPQSVYDDYAEFNGIEVVIGEYQMTTLHMVLSLVIFMVVFYLLSVWKLSKSKL